MESENGECQNSIQHCPTSLALNTRWAQSWLEFESELYQKFVEIKPKYIVYIVCLFVCLYEKVGAAC